MPQTQTKQVWHPLGPVGIAANCLIANKGNPWASNSDEFRVGLIAGESPITIQGFKFERKGGVFRVRTRGIVLVGSVIVPHKVRPSRKNCNDCIRVRQVDLVRARLMAS